MPASGARWSGWAPPAWRGRSAGFSADGPPLVAGQPWWKENAGDGQPAVWYSYSPVGTSCAGSMDRQAEPLQSVEAQRGKGDANGRSEGTSGIAFRRNRHRRRHVRPVSTVPLARTRPDGARVRG